MGAIEAMRTADRKAKSCGHSLSIATLDVAKALDQFGAYSVERACLEQAPARVIAAVLLDMVDQKVGKARHAPTTTRTLL